MNSYQDLDINLIKPDPEQPRKIFEDDSLTDLSNSIKATGVKQPITVRKVNNEYMIIAGERRYRASILANKTTIPAVIIGDESQLTEEALYAHQLNENLHREDLNPIEKAEFINKRIEYLKKTGDENPRETVCKELGISASWLSKSLAPLKLSDDLRQLVMEGKVKDYDTVKKIKNLGDRKRKEAIELINNGEFNSKEFFSRRKKKDEDKNNLDESIENNEVDLPVVKEENYNIKVTRSQLESIFKSTGFIHTINTLTTEEKEILFSKNKKELVNKFLESITSSS
ncbi:TPA: ParB/RepB/Spo0J family partition protein [Acinetobacter baumannii]|nr:MULTISPECIES: ParB/RepB/Spo0J family partition protein [Acinetobacter calcoaceticus/baumannii complex]MCW8631784.1 ParB/RepB/Spo0J family partition protein [Acinetobacter baumannii]MCW8642893.1 ParB/RepB/Spo0J family partition protein [Acinetobacter baumannii]MDC4606704.1 ParB/RepB/Spo0J family partition protein [Acinetobacter baumannii]MDN8535669.1 ParB/RepB/Spo0J family partition protein [Acinetobacter baumannii]MDO7359627.1 ParB/RepB/Spo0J family partition protein [Acinetobacter baumanni